MRKHDFTWAAAASYRTVIGQYLYMFKNKTYEFPNRQPILALNKTWGNKRCRQQDVALLQTYRFGKWLPSTRHQTKWNDLFLHDPLPLNGETHTINVVVFKQR